MKINIGEIEITNDTNVLDIEVPKEMENNVSTGHKIIDRMFAGDGVTPSTVSLVTGMPGAGKSTLMIQLADCITRSGNIALYNTGEESLYQIRRVVKRLGLHAGFFVGHDRNVKDILAHVEELQQRYPDKQVFLFQDSLQTLEIEREEGQRGRPLSGAKAQMVALEQLTSWAKNTYGCLFLVGQVNKKGEFAGKNEIKHIVDCHLHLGYVIDDKYNESACAEMQKNRFGIGNIYFYFELTESGITFRAPKTVVQT